MVEVALLPDAVVPEHLPGEPRRVPPSDGRLLAWLLVRWVGVIVLAGVVAPLWPVYLLGAARWGWAPNVLRAGRVVRFLRLAVTVRPARPGLPRLWRWWLAMRVVQKAVGAPIGGIAWHLDELLYRRRLDAVVVAAPLIEISAARSGSTQLARYLEGDATLAAPSVLQAFFPFLWLWRLMAFTVGRWVSRESVDRFMHGLLPPEFVERHEGNAFGTDTLEAAFYVSHLNAMSVFLGPDVFVDEFGPGVAAPHNRQLWEVDFVAWFDRIGRKTLVFAGSGVDGRARRLFVKGHFLAAADAVERRYPDARFLTMVREPAARVQSVVNFLRANPLDGTLGAPPWGWLAEGVVRMEVAYCEAEQAWFERLGGARRCVVRFDEYVRDLEGSMTRVYRECLDRDNLPAHVPRSHAPRVRRDYSLDRSLAEVGIDEGALLARLAGYVAWCRGAG